MKPTNDIVTGDYLRWTEPVWSGYSRYGKSRKIGERIIWARVVSDSYGADKQQHTFTLLVDKAEGFDPPQPGDKIRRKGRNLYRGDPHCGKWVGEGTREDARNEKHTRGNLARTARDERYQATF